MKVGDKIVAIDDCRMDGSNIPSLTIGRTYEVIEKDKTGFFVIDDDRDLHRFENYSFSEFFEELKTDPIVESVINQFKTRSEIGIKKYGTTLERNDLSTLEWLQHLQEELMDAVCYIEKLKQDGGC